MPGATALNEVQVVIGFHLRRPPKHEYCRRCLNHRRDAVFFQACCDASELAHSPVKDAFGALPNSSIKEISAVNPGATPTIVSASKQ